MNCRVVPAMFSTLKSKIKEETGSDVAAMASINQNRRSSSRCNSIVFSANIESSSKASSENVEIDSRSSEKEPLQCQLDDLRKKYDLLLGGYDKALAEKAHVEKTNAILEEALKVAQIQKEFIFSEHEKTDNVRLEEISKLKNLLHFREQVEMHERN